MTIVVVDDKPELYTLYAKLLCLAGHAAVGLAGDRQTLTKLRQLQPDLVLLDLNMAPLNGLDLLAQLREDPTLRHLRVAMLTSTPDAQAQTAARSLGVLDYLPKGLEWEPLRLRIERCLPAPGSKPTAAGE